MIEITVMSDEKITRATNDFMISCSWVWSNEKFLHIWTSANSYKDLVVTKNRIMSPEKAVKIHVKRRTQMTLTLA